MRHRRPPRRVLARWLPISERDGQPGRRRPDGAGSRLLVTEHQACLRSSTSLGASSFMPGCGSWLSGGFSSVLAGWAGSPAEAAASPGSSWSPEVATVTHGGEAPAVASLGGDQTGISPSPPSSTARERHHVSARKLLTGSIAVRKVYRVAIHISVSRERSHSSSWGCQGCGSPQRAARLPAT